MAAANGLSQGESLLLLPLLQGLLLSNAAALGYRLPSALVTGTPGDVSGSSGGTGGSSSSGSGSHGSGTSGGSSGSNGETAGRSGVGVASVSTGPPVEDSGTESGEDLRLLVAGLHDNLGLYQPVKGSGQPEGVGAGVGRASESGSATVSASGTNGAGGIVVGRGVATKQRATGGAATATAATVVAPSGASAPSAANAPNVLSEVTAALERLQRTLRGGEPAEGGAALGGPGEVMQLDAEQRYALLALVARLQQGLLQPDKIAEPILADGGSVGGRRPSLGEPSTAGSLDASQPPNRPNNNNNNNSNRSGNSRFGAKRRTNRSNRHTVGVSREELADARRFIEEMVMMDHHQQPAVGQRSVVLGAALEPAPPPPPHTTVMIANHNTAGAHLLQKQHSLGPETLGRSVANGGLPESPAFAMKRPSQFMPKEIPYRQPPTNHQQMTLLLSPPPPTTPPSTVYEGAAPLVPARSKTGKQKLLLRQSLSVDQAQPPTTTGQPSSSSAATATNHEVKPIDLHKHSTPLVSLAKQQQQQQQQQEQNKQPSSNVKQPLDQQQEQPFKAKSSQRAHMKKYSLNGVSGGEVSSEDDDDDEAEPRPPSKTAEQVVLRHHKGNLGGGHPSSIVVNTVQKIVNREVKAASAAAAATAAAPDGGVNNGVSAGRQPACNKYTTKKLRMKRANTIDIPKNLLAADDNSEDEGGDVGEGRVAKSRSQGKGKAAAPSFPHHPPLSGGPAVAAPAVEVPDFRPRTENDLKFLAFLQRQNQQQSQRQVWSNPLREAHVGSNNWTNKFDHLKSNFEGVGDRRSRSELPPRHGAAPKASAMSFWRKQAESSSFDEGTHRSGGQQSVSKAAPTAAGTKQPTIGGRSSTASNPSSAIASSPPVVEGRLVLPKSNRREMAGGTAGSGSPQSQNQFSHAPASVFKPIPRKLPPANLEFKPIQPSAKAIVKPIPAHASNATGLVKQLVAAGFHETAPDAVKPEPMNIQLGLVRSLAAQGYQETPFVPLPKLERTPTHNVLNYKPRPDASSMEQLPGAAPWAGKRSSGGGGGGESGTGMSGTSGTSTGSRVASIASSKFTANPFGHAKPVAAAATLPAQPPLTYHGSLKYSERPLAYQVLPGGGIGTVAAYEKRPSLPDVSAIGSGGGGGASGGGNSTFTFTDYSQPTSVSTFALNRSESLTNPDNEPLVLTSYNNVYSPSAIATRSARSPQAGSGAPKQQQQITYLAVNVDQQSSSSLSPANGDDDDDEYDGDDLDSVDSQEMRAVSKVMRGPVSQQATYSAASRRPTHLSAHQDSRGLLPIAQSLQSTLKKIKDKSPTPPKYPTQPPPPPPHFEPTGGAHIIYNNVTHPLARTKSSHTLTVSQQPAPATTSINDKQRTVEAYFAGQHPMARTTSSHNLATLRDKTGLVAARTNAVRPVSYALATGGYHHSRPAPAANAAAQYQPTNSHYYFASAHQSPAYRQPAGMLPVHAGAGAGTGPSSSSFGGGTLLRSRTMPHIPLGNLALLDENNVEDAFEELMNQSFAV
uniref:Putative titin isoform x2 n=1 Tax=Anopheles darlingi TaxID=43151 RepID=A0A2M4D111_ANODA